MARRLADAGHDLVLWNRDTRKAAAVAADLEAAVADTPAEAVRGTDLVITSLADDAAVKDVYLSGKGVVAALTPGQVAVDTSTIDPETVSEVGAAADAVGAVFLDCPVSGSVATVESGDLVVMAGGDPIPVSMAETVLAAFAKEVVRTGPRGSGAACKLAVNGLVHGLNIALSEALVLAERAGVPRQVAYGVFANGAAGAPFVHYKREAYEHPERAQVAFTLDLVAKDLGLITALANRVGAPMRQARTGLAIVQEAISEGLGGRDLSAVAVHLRGGD